ncbi:zinc dependent phospholipase C family protein [Paenibacillus montanisoli]|uniref:Phospholipase C/D domain-containing protein n=1 Tax=Paenibacillus montanisoli TaxID=2081970 RepID=A0A328U3H3_9BACL|nr:zinc dependent phospholipase C family protein [Paenibacillus montanisoli]RAP77377.1 hypothetical protein DL346_02500 [Paenibacillus montanisoli]
MPNVWTHLLFGQKCLQALGEQHLIESPHRKTMFNMGCQGPDFLFYHRFLPWQKSRTLTRLGSEMHRLHCGPVLLDLLDSLDNLTARTDKSAREDALVYTLGFVLHHVLDRVMHPYVFSRSGNRKWDHQRFEILMDTLIVQKLLGIETWKTEVWREINNKGELPASVVDAFEQIAAVHYPKLAPIIRREHWTAAMRDMIAAQRLFYDPTGLRRIVTFGKIEPLVYKRELPGLDVLNESRKPWLDPVDGQTLHHESVWDLWDKAMSEAIDIISAILVWLREKEPLEPILDVGSEIPSKHQLREAVARLIGNRSYETGLPCESGASIQFEDPIWTQTQML